MGVYENTCTVVNEGDKRNGTVLSAHRQVPFNIITQAIHQLKPSRVGFMSQQKNAMHYGIYVTKNVACGKRNFFFQEGFGRFNIFRLDGDYISDLLTLTE